MIPGKGIVQINHTLTARRGTVRGMHFQRPPHAETKFVSCLRGEVFDVAVDIRARLAHLPAAGTPKSSAPTTTGPCVIPEGFAHGFQALTDDCEMLYLHTAAYHPEAECGLNAAGPAARHPLAAADRRAVAARRGAPAR